MMKLCSVNDLFEVKYGVNLELNTLEADDSGINFVSRTSKNNGVSAKVKKIADIEPIPSGTISVAGGGSVMESFLQIEPYYSGRDLYFLTPKVEMSNAVKLYYCLCLRSNKFRFSYGRQANTTLSNIQIPTLDSIPEEIQHFSIENYGKSLLNQVKLDEKSISVAKSSNNVLLEEIFLVVNGIASSNVVRSKTKVNDNWIPYIRPSYRQETSIDAYVNSSLVSNDMIFPEGTLYVSTDGQGSHTFSYVSTFSFVPNSNVSVLLPKRQMSIEEKLFYAMCITRNRYKFSYGRKPKGERLKKILIPEYPPSFLDNYRFDKNMEHFEKILRVI